MKFSIIITACNRGNLLQRCLKSIVLFQEYDDFEVIVVDDGSREDLKSIVGRVGDPRIRYLRQEKRMERVMGYKRGFEEAQGEWITYVGSDDVLYPRLLFFLTKHFERHPNHKLFNYGWGVVNRHNWSITAAPGRRFKFGEHFESGVVAAGSFCWHKSLTEQIELPEVMDCYAFADQSGIPGYGRALRTLGNPWGEDYYIFWKLTRKNLSVHLPLLGMIAYIR